LKKFTHPGDSIKMIPRPRTDKPARLDLDFSLYIDLNMATYAHLAQYSPLGIHKPFCLFQYYCITLVWRRLFILSYELWGQTRAPNGNSLRTCYPNTLLVPPSIREYLRNLGKVTDPFNTTRHPATIFSFHSGHRHYGLAYTHTYNDFSLYETVLYPRIALWKIEADVKFTKSRDTPSPYWIPQPYSGLTPIHPWTRPNRNLLGYHPAEKLTSKQMETLSRIGFRPPFEYRIKLIEGYPIHEGALKVVDRALRKTTPKKYHHQIPQNLTGSLAQLPFTEWLQTPYNQENDSNLEATINSHFPFSLQIILLANLFRYRLCRANYTGQCGI